MKTILEIDHYYLLLPESANVNTIIKTLSSAKRARRRFGGEHDLYELEGEPRIEIKVIKEKNIIDPKSRKRIPEKASEDCNGLGV